MNKLSRANFCTCVREAITALGYSTVQALNVCNSELGQLNKSKVGEDRTGDVKARMFKSADKEDRASCNYKPGTETYTGRLTDALSFLAFNDSIAKAEKLCPTMKLQIEKDSAFGMWLGKVATPKPTEVKPIETELVSK